ncbi:short-chain dehydrogenase reductase [Fusarium oxysporum f. sp. phaseoli]
MGGMGKIMRSQFKSLPYPTKKFTGQTIIVTGSNVGLGLEAARHFVRLDASKVILAVRTIKKGEAAAASIETTGRKGVVEVWELDLCKSESVQKFASRVDTLDRLDVFMANAGIMAKTFTKVEGNESQITVNVINTMLLGIMVLPALRASAIKYNKPGVLSFTGSFVHYVTEFPERNAPNIFEDLADEGKARMADRYNVSKMMELLAVRELATKMTESKKDGQVIVSVVNPGWVKTNMGSGEKSGLFAAFGRRFIARETEVGSRTLVHAAEGDPEIHGQYLSDCKTGEVSSFVSSDAGAEAQKKVWRELSNILEGIKPGVMSSI